MAAPTIGKLSSMYAHAWKSGLKTTYYLRSRPATRIQQATTSGASTSTENSPVAGIRPLPVPAVPAGSVKADATNTFTDEEALACSLENPESCEACQ